MGDDVLVTGASGFVGSAVVATLAQQNRTGTVAVARRSLRVPPGVRLVRVSDIGPETDWRPALRGISHVVHCAALVHVMRQVSGGSLGDYRRVNTHGTLALARRAAEMGVRRFVFLSSVKVNGESTAPGRPFREDDPPRPPDPYAQSKLEAEQGLRRLAAESAMDVVVIRPVLVYGPGVKGNFRTMLKWVARGVPLPFGLVQNRRSFVGLTNLVDFIDTCLYHPAAANETFLVSDGADLSTAELLQKTGSAVERPARLLPFPPPLLRAAAYFLGESAKARRLLDSLVVDIRKAHRLLGWRPPMSVEDELNRTADAFYSPASQ